MFEYGQPPTQLGGSVLWPESVVSFPDPGSNCEPNLLPKVTIVTPSFNQGQYLEETIRSVLMQNYSNLEYIIIDGGSTDNSVEIIRKYEPWLAFWISEPDGGQASAINKGFSRSTGEYLGWINSDDILYSDAIKRVMGAFDAHPNIDLVYGDVLQGQKIDQSSRPLLGQQLEFTEMLRTLQVPIPQQGSLWKRAVIDQCGSLDDRWHVVLDREFFTRVAQKCQILYLPGVLGFFRNHEYSKSVSQKSRWLAELPQMYREFFDQRDLPIGLRQLQRETMGVVFLTCASIACQCGKFSCSAGYLVKAFWIDPLFVFRRYVRSKMTILFKSIVSKA
jgi:glycosyltransferase involved in cell wall biosynthesis